MNFAGFRITENHIEQIIQFARTVQNPNGR